MEINAVNIIQAMLAPGIMISACGLLLLGMNNKYSLIVNRIRLLDDEKRKLTTIPKKGNLNPDEELRLNSITMQIEKFSFRIRMVRNTVITYTVAVGCFIFASLAIGLYFVVASKIISTIAILLFLSGMVSVMVGVFHAAYEVRKGYEIVQIEIREG
jgi:hypothetical protein